jgi:hypothetical protein
VRLVALPIVLASLTAHAEPPLARIGAFAGYQQSDRAAWVFGPSLEVRLYKDISIHGDAQLELGDIDDPFGESNIRGGDGPHVNHVMFGPTWRPSDYNRYQLALGAQAGVMVMHSNFAEKAFNKRPAVGMFVQGGKLLGPVSLAVQLRFDFSTTVEMGDRDGSDTPTTTGRLNFVFEVPIKP